MSLSSGLSLKNNGTAVRSAAFRVVVNFNTALMIQGASVVYFPRFYLIKLSCYQFTS